MFRSPEDIAKHRRRSLGLVLLALLLLASAISMSPATSYSAEGPAKAHAARSQSADATAHLHLIRAEGSQLFEEGPVSGALAGSMRAELNTGAVFTGSFTTRTNGGSIKGHGVATPHGSGRYQSFSGSLRVTGGSGRYAHVNGHAGLFGVFDRRTDTVVVQTTGTLTY